MIIKKHLSFKSKLFSSIDTVPAQLIPNYYPSVDGMRAIAVLMVTLAHFGFDMFPLPYGLSIESLMGVYIFFVLSGFLITTQLIKEKLTTGTISVKRFYIRRILRIIPLAYLFLFVLIIISVCYGSMSSDSDFLISFLFIKNLPVKNHPFTAHLWTLSVEEQFYVILPLLIYLSLKKYFTIALLLAVLIPFISILSYHHIGFYCSNHIYLLVVKIIQYSFWKAPTIILIGSVFAILAFKGVNFHLPSKYYFLSFFLLLAAILISTKNFIFYSKYISEFLSAIIIAYVILLNIYSNNFLTKVLSNPILIKIGILSYSLYMWQELFLGRFFWIPWLKFLNTMPLLVIIFIKFILLIPIAFISYRFIESPFLKWKAKYK